MADKLIRFATIGTNFITDELLEAAREVQNFELAAVYSRDENKAREFAAKHGAAHIFTDLTEMAESQLIDAVYIASPNALHHSQSLLFLNNGKHVLCEKAIASNVGELKDMIKAAKKNQVLLMEAMRPTMVPNLRILKESLHKIGKVRKYFAVKCQYSSRYDKYKQGIVLNAFKPELSNGALMDIGIYCIHPMIYLFGKPKEVKASAYMLESGVDGEGSALFKYDDMEAQVMYSKITNSHLPCEIQGEEGSILIDRIHDFHEVKIIYRDGKEEIISEKQYERDMRYEIEEFISLIHQGKTESPINSFENSLAALEVMDEIRRQIGLAFPADK